MVFMIQKKYSIVPMAEGIATQRCRLRVTKAGITIFIMVIIAAAFSCNNPAKNNKAIFHYNEATGIATMDPAFAKNQSIMWAVHQVYNTLVETDSNLNIVPLLATHWLVSDDRKTYTFYLRNDVWFHDSPAFKNGKGRKMTAADVVYSLQRIIDRKTASSGAWIFNNKVDSLQGFRAINDTVFQLQLLQPFNPILGLLSMQYCSVVPKEVVEFYGKDFRTHACGTGPFKMMAWEEGQAMVLVKNGTYFEKDKKGERLPYLDGIKISFFDSKATEFLLFQQEQLDFINDLDASFKDEVLTKKGVLKKEWNGKLNLVKHPYLNIEYLGLLVDSTNTALKNSPTRLTQIRKAINYGFDRRKMMLYLRNSIGIPAESGFVPSGLPSFNAHKVKGYYYDPVKAKQLVKEAGFNSNNPLPAIKLLTIPIYSDLASFIARELEDVGINVQVEVVQKSFLLEQTAKAQALFFRGSWIADYPDAENYLSCFYSKNPSPPNYTRYKNPAFDALYEQALIATSDSLRYLLYQQMDQLLMNDAPVVPLWYDEIFRLVNPKVSGFRPNALNLLELRTTKIEKIF
jgi:oligopeptide transport system substrate-binding protein